MSTGMGQIKEVESYSHSGAHAAVGEDEKVHGSLMGSVCARCACVCTHGTQHSREAQRTISGVGSCLPP